MLRFTGLTLKGKLYDRSQITGCQVVGAVGEDGSKRSRKGSFEGEEKILYLIMVVRT